MEAGRPLGDRVADQAESRLLRALFDQVPAMVAYWDHEARNVVANAAYVEWFGLEPAKIRGLHISEVLGAEVYAKNLPFIEGVLNGGEQAFDRTLVDTSGRTRHTQASYVPDLVDGEVRGFFVLVTDVTPRVEAQRAMNEAQSLAHLGSWSLVPDTGEITWSDELYRIFGVDRSEFAPTLDALMSLVHPDDHTRAGEIRSRALADRTEYSSHYRICRPDGAVREVQSRGRPMLDAAGFVVRLSGTLQDVTEARQASREMARVNAELRQVNQLNADVIGMLGHDVRAPLTVMLGYLEELEEEWPVIGEPDRRAHVTTVRSAADKLRALVDDILALAALDAGSILPRPEAHDLAGVVRDALEDVPGGAAITVDHGAGPVSVSCDAFHVRQVLINLATNALRYGGPPVTVSLAADEETATVTVSDHGPGVEPDFVPHLFEHFARSTGNQLPGSTGFGLYIAARLAEANRGSLQYAPRGEGQGSMFVLTLPRVR